MNNSRMTLRQQTFLFNIGKRGFNHKVNIDEYALVLQSQKILNRRLNHNTLNVQIKSEKHRIDKVRADAVFSDRLITYKRMNTLTPIQHSNLEKANLIISGWLSMLNPELEAIVNSSFLRLLTDKENCLQKLQDRAFGFIFSFKPARLNQPMANYIRGSIYLKKLSLFTEKDRILYGLNDLPLKGDSRWSAQPSNIGYSGCNIITPDPIDVIAEKLNTSNRTELKQYKKELLLNIA